MSSSSVRPRFTLEDLMLAYRKAKVDLYYKPHKSLFDLLKYEQDLVANLSRLRDQLNRSDRSWIANIEFLGGWAIAPKSVTFRDSTDEEESLVYSSAMKGWTNRISRISPKKPRDKPEAEFRVMADCSIDFHVLSTLWIMKVGEKFDRKLGKCSYGNRLRRTREEQSFNTFALGSFRPYLYPYREWRDRGIAAMREALKDGKSIVALTADISSFYHELNAHFMLNPDFVEQVLGLKLDLEEQHLHELFIEGMKYWASNTPLGKGLPVGLPAAAIVANVALIELDRLVEQQVAPLYYGRYVDDVLLVMENGANFQSKADVWEWLFHRSQGKLEWAKPRKEVRFVPSYLARGQGKSSVQFSNSKNKCFMLSGQTGSTLVEAIAAAIRARSSEWRAMPRLPSSAENLGTKLLWAVQSDGEEADNLRKADSLTMRRAHFAITLRDLEAYELDLNPQDWKAQRAAFFDAFIDHVLVLPNFFELEIYLTRVLRLATRCGEFKALGRMLQAIDQLCRHVEDDCQIAVKALSPQTLANRISPRQFMGQWRTSLFSMFYENVVAAFPLDVSEDEWRLFEVHILEGVRKIPELSDRKFGKNHLTKQSVSLFAHDLGDLPFRFSCLPKEMLAQRGIPPRKVSKAIANSVKLLPSGIRRGCEALATWCELSEVPAAITFATRPFSLTELFILKRDACSAAGLKEMRSIVLSTRGFSMKAKMPVLTENALKIPDSDEAKRYRIAVASWKTEMGSWVASVTKSADPDRERYARICRLVDSIISYSQGCRYLILPELSLPARWFMRLAKKLHGRGISLVAGVEYLHTEPDLVHNQVWASLSHNGFGFPSPMIYRQDKQRPALHENKELRALGGVTLQPHEDHLWKVPPIIEHGNFRFAILVCSELTNIKYRAALRGKIDALFVPEWNQDTETFNSLVESSALDMHAYVIQCNNREFGDSRIRSPAKDSYKRDILRVKGGLVDYCVIGEIDVKALRQFQSREESPRKPYKPVPDGFRMHPERWEQPLADSDD